MRAVWRAFSSGNSQRGFDVARNSFRLFGGLDLDLDLKTNIQRGGMNSALRWPPSFSAPLSEHAANVMVRSFSLSWSFLLRQLRWTMAGLLIVAVLCSLFGVHPASHCEEHVKVQCTQGDAAPCCPGDDHPGTEDSSCSCDCLCQTAIHINAPTLVLHAGMLARLAFLDPPLRLKNVVLEPDPPPVRRV